MSHVLWVKWATSREVGSSEDRRLSKLVFIFLFLSDYRPVELRQASPRQAPLAPHLRARHRDREREQGEHTLSHTH